MIGIGIGEQVGVSTSEKGWLTVASWSGVGWDTAGTSLTSLTAMVKVADVSRPALSVAVTRHDEVAGVGVTRRAAERGGGRVEVSHNGSGPPSGPEARRVSVSPVSRSGSVKESSGRVKSSGRSWSMAWSGIRLDEGSAGHRR